MKVYKYCRPEHNPFNNCRTIILGNNRTFRENYRGEGDFINDANEGISYGTDENENVYAGKFNPDVLLFCTSTKLLDWPIVHDNFDPNYISRYCIINIEKFSLYLLREVAGQLTHPYLYSGAVYQHVKPFIEQYGITIEEYMNQMSVEPVSSTVEYKELKDVRIGGVFDSFEFLKATNFNKLPVYSNQYEYRVLFVVKNLIQNIFFNISLPHLLLNVPGIMDYVEEC